MTSIRTLLASALLAALSNVGQADVIAFWSFNSLGDEDAKSAPADESATETKPTASWFGGSAVPAGQRGESFSDDGQKYSAGKAIAWQSGVNDEGPNGLLLTVDTTGYTGLSLRFDCRSTKTGAPTMTVQCRAGAGEFVNVATDVKLAGDKDFHEMTVDLAKVTSANDAEKVEIRFEFAPGTQSGTTRIDNLRLDGKEK